MGVFFSPYNRRDSSPPISGGFFHCNRQAPYSSSLQLTPLFRGIFLEWNFRVGAWGARERLRPWRRWSVVVVSGGLSRCPPVACGLFSALCGVFCPCPIPCPCAVVSVALVAFFRLWWRFACVALALVALCGAIFTPSVPFSLFGLVRTNPPRLKRLKTAKNRLL